MYKFKVSVIMAVYNVEPFIREAIDSIIAQDIGFENIQLILVDDGSPDGSGAICDEYAEKYPDNIVVVHKENGGVSSARNAGLDRVEGEFVNFMDPDDKLDSNAVSAALRFFRKYGEQTDVVTFPMKFFDAKKGEHTLNYKYAEGTRLLDLDEEWANPQCSMSSTFVRSECFSDLRFDMRISQAEDLHLMQRILLKKHTMGVMSETAYWYRKRSIGEQSAVQSRLMKKAGYAPMLKYVEMDTILHCLEREGCVPKFIQNTLMYDMQWILRRNTIPVGVLTEEEKQEFFGLIPQVLQYIDDDVIEAQRNLNQEHRAFAYQLKYGDALSREVQEQDISLCVGGESKICVSNHNIRLKFWECGPEYCQIEGDFLYLPALLQEYRLFVQCGDGSYEAELLQNRAPVICLDQEVLQTRAFRVRVPLKAEKKQTLSFFCEADGVQVPLKLLYGRYFPVSAKYDHNFYADKNWVLMQQQNVLLLKPRHFGSFMKHELVLCRELWASKHRIARNSVLSRLMLHVLKPFKRKPIWLISDRASKAGDNGEAFFRYVRENHPEINAWYVINADCPDYEMMKQFGPVVAKDSFRHKILHLLSDYIISSHGENDIYNPFHRSYEHYRNLLVKDKYVFLQHGITQNDLSGWLQRSNKNFTGFITTAVPEWDSIVKGDYEYTENEVWLTGFPRFDRLYQDSQKWITIIPTWRKYLMGTCDLHTGKWTLSPESANSAYIRFYNSLLNDPRLHEAAQKYGYQLKFLPHPTMQKHLDVFDTNDHVSYLGTETAYRDVYAKSDLVITDYSSAVFDFAYMRKPVLYTQFDAEEFFSGEHVCIKGYFDYKRDGFGEVEYDLDSTVARIIEYMENGCRMKDEYRQRADKFFAFNDQNNCRRVFEKIMETEENGKK